MQEQPTLIPFISLAFYDSCNAFIAMDDINCRQHTHMHLSSLAFGQVGQMKQRPKPDDLELAMMNASASQSALTKTVAWARGLVPGGVKKQ